MVTATIRVESTSCAALSHILSIGLPSLCRLFCISGCGIPIIPCTFLDMFWSSFCCLSQFSPCGIVVHFDCSLLSGECQMSRVPHQPRMLEHVRVGQQLASKLKGKDLLYADQGVHWPIIFGRLEWNNSAQKLIQLACVTVILSGAVLDGLMETQEARIIKLMLL